MSRVYIGVGHSGSEVGATANGLVEAAINLTTALACRDELKKNGVDTKISRTTATGGAIKINDKVNEANAFNPDFVVEIHHNAGGGIGSEVYYSKVGGKGKTLAQSILKSLVATGQKSRGIKTKLSGGQDYFGIIRDTKAPAVLVEVGFLDSSDHENFDTESEQKEMGVAIAQGVLKTLGIEPKKDTYTVQKGDTLNDIAEKNGVTLKDILVANPQILNPDIISIGAKINLSGNIPKKRPLLKSGSEGREVSALQEALNKFSILCNFSPLFSDGIFGKLTDAAVRAFQKKKGLAVDGIVGPDTYKALGI